MPLKECFHVPPGSSLRDPAVRRLACLSHGGVLKQRPRQDIMNFHFKGVTSCEWLPRFLQTKESVQCDASRTYCVGWLLKLKNRSVRKQVRWQGTPQIKCLNCWKSWLHDTSYVTLLYISERSQKICAQTPNTGAIETYGLPKIPLPLRAIVTKMMTSAIALKRNMRLCFSVLSCIFFEVVLANVISTIAISMAVLCSTNQ